MIVKLTQVHINFTPNLHDKQEFSYNLQHFTNEVFLDFDLKGSLIFLTGIAENENSREENSRNAEKKMAKTPKRKLPKRRKILTKYEFDAILVIEVTL